MFYCSCQLVTHRMCKEIEYSSFYWTNSEESTQFGDFCKNEVFEAAVSCVRNMYCYHSADDDTGNRDNRTQFMLGWFFEFDEFIETSILFRKYSIIVSWIYIKNCKSKHFSSYKLAKFDVLPSERHLAASLVFLFSLHQETICDANAERKLQNFVSKCSSSPQMHARWQHQIPSMHMLRGWVGGGVGGFTEFDVEFIFAKIQNSYVEGGWGGSQNLMLSSNLLKSKIPMLRVGWSGGCSRNLMLSSNLLKSKIPMLRVGTGGGCFRNLMLSSNLLKSKIPMLRVGGWVDVGGFMEFDVEFKFAKIPNSYVEGGWGVHGIWCWVQIG